MNRRVLFALAKAAVSVLLIWFLVSRIDFNEMQSRLAGLSLSGAAFAVFVLGVQAIAATQRWRVVAQTMGVLIEFGRASRIVLIGLFFNQTLPSSIGGDAVRVWMVTQDGTRLGKAVNIVLGDRVLALMVLVILMAVTLPLLLDRVSDPVITHGMTILVAVGCAGILLFLIAGRQIAMTLGRWRVTRPFGELAADFRSLFYGFGPAAQLVGWSAMIHVLTVASIFVLAGALGVAAGFLDCLIIVPAVILATTIPVSVAGWGVREGAMVVGFSQIGIASPDALAISICFGLAQIVVGLPGGLLWLIHRKKDPPTAS